MRSLRIPPGVLLSVVLSAKRTRQAGFTVGRVGHGVCVCMSMRYA